MFKVTKEFHDLTDGKYVKGGMVYHHYSVGDIYPRQGLTPQPSEDRIAELQSDENAQGVPLIEVVEGVVAEEVPVEAVEEAVEAVAEEVAVEPAAKPTRRRTTARKTTRKAKKG
jgi:hypothetical protein